MTLTQRSAVTSFIDIKQLHQSDQDFKLYAACATNAKIALLPAESIEHKVDEEATISVVSVESQYLISNSMTRGPDTVQILILGRFKRVNVILGSAAQKFYSFANINGLFSLRLTYYFVNR